ncbi:SubName: Full=Uncharacterized protein {ECO:0000313/EMBL:CCA66646.1} [Serendipita indica DSM 11827]|nr:SubName: Full=Uncharacterized protein {ECO:0000313/EMBL:CCA66646.1} [Serendipita indica DSM 11827]
MDSGSHKHTLLTGNLNKRYQNRRQLSEILHKGRTDRGHFAGKLVALERDNSTRKIVIVVKENQGKRIKCSLPPSKNLYHNLTAGITKDIQVAMSNPAVVVLDVDKSVYYDYQLEYDQYQFILGQELFSTIPDAWRGSSDEEEIPTQSHERVTLPDAQESQSTHQQSKHTAAPNAKLGGKMPPDWTPILNVNSYLGNRVEKIAGIVHRADPIRTTKWEIDWAMELDIVDETSIQPLEIKLYASEKVHLPPEGIIDKAIMFTKLRILQRKGAYNYAQGDKNVFQYTCYENNDIFHDVGFVRLDDDANPRPERIHWLTSMDREGLQRLLRWSRNELRPVEQIPKPNGRSSLTHKLLKDIAHNESITCTVEILDIWTESHEVDLKVTDYTASPHLFEPNSTRWSHPPGRRTMRVRLRDDAAGQAQNLVVGNIYRIKNIRIKDDRGLFYANGGKGPSGSQGTLISSVDPSDTYYKELLARKRRLEGGGSLTSSPTNPPDPLPVLKSPTKATLVQPTSVEAGPPSASIDETEQPIQQQSASIAEPSVTNKKGKVSVENRDLPVLRESYPEFPRFMGEVEIASTVECANAPRHPHLTLKDIRYTPQVPRMFYFYARIVDIIPSGVADAVHSSCTKCGPIDKREDTHACPRCKRSNTVQHSIRFHFVLQDSERELPVEVFDEAADIFFCISDKSKRDRNLLIPQVARRLHHLMGTTGGSNSLQVGGISEIFGFVGKVYMTLENDDPCSGQWLRRYALSGCRIRGPNAR